ncbi:hypothetical protein FIBSPDRAFT_897432 [Athelia psychrophila]|uniref:Uncharacterized protein n=1 Tax=Athelia psychrophila TaxID=1759441 RepID=A0A166C8D4_9AGAM|nr:hypothetical protein FIBSPDRAFT_897432 [Fibularhizoctonia sp. CBS 109695]
MASTTPLLMIIVLLNKQNNPEQPSSIQPTVDNDTGSTDVVKWIIFKNLVSPPLPQLPPSTLAPPSMVINTIPPPPPPLLSTNGNHFTVWWWDITPRSTNKKLLAHNSVGLFRTVLASQTEILLNSTGQLELARSKECENMWYRLAIHFELNYVQGGVCWPEGRFENRFSMVLAGQTKTGRAGYWLARK